MQAPKQMLIDFAIFAALMFAAGLVSPIILTSVPSLAALGVAGTVVSYAVASVPAYILLVWLWRKRK